MATIEDQILAIGTKLDTIIANQNAAAATVDLSGVLTAIAGVKTDTAAILAQDEPTPVAPTPAPDSAPAA